MAEKEKYIIHADASKCKGCKMCETACNMSHYGLTKKEAMKNKAKLTPRIRVYKSGDLKMPIQCRHCENAPCAKACPTKALVHEDGFVKVRDQYCVGCKMCVMACPFGAITVADKHPVLDDSEAPARTGRGVALKCDLCEDWRRENGKDVSACVEACKLGALQFMTMTEYRAMKLAEAAKRIQDEASPEKPQAQA